MADNKLPPSVYPPDEEGKEPLVFKHVDDYPEVPVTLTTMKFNKTGAWRNVKPVITDHKVGPCVGPCPMWVLIPKFMDLVVQERLEDAARVILERNPFPSITGRICPAPCEKPCNRRKLDEPVAIRSVERFLGDLGVIEEPGEPTGKKVAIVGSNIAGLAAAYYLRRWGHEVTVFESGSVICEHLRGREDLPEEVLEREIEKVKTMGAEIITNAADPDLSGFDAVLYAMTEVPKDADKTTGVTDDPRIFKAGHTEPVRSMGAAKKAALSVHQYLTGQEIKPEPRPSGVVTPSQVNYFHFPLAPRTKNEDMSKEEAIYEANRCFSCGNCNSCGNCWVYCPDNAIQWVNDLPVVNYDYCKGCGVCVVECPRGVIDLEPEWK